MTSNFDPYHKWLGIPREEQPAHHYRLLGIPVFEEDLQVIEAAADRQMTFLRRFQAAEHAEHAKKLLNEVSRARLCLLKPESKSRYDQQLNQLLEQASDDEEEGAEVSDEVNPMAGIQLDLTRGSRRPFWQRTNFIAGVVAVIVVSVGFLMFLNSGRGKPPLKAQVAQNSHTENTGAERENPNDRNSKQNSNGGNEEEEVKTIRPGLKDDQSRPLATGDKAPWPTLQDGETSLSEQKSLKEQVGAKGNPSLANVTSDGKQEGMRNSPSALPEDPGNSSSDLNVPTISAEENLVSKIDLSRDVIAGDWSLEEGVLIKGGGANIRIRIPCQVPKAYTLIVVAERKIDAGRGLYAILPVGSGQALVAVDGWDGQTSGMEFNKGAAGNGNETTTHGHFLKQGMNTFVYRVHPNGVRVEVNGRKVFDWKGDGKDLTYDAPGEHTLEISGDETPWRIHGIKVEPITLKVASSTTFEDSLEGSLVVEKKSVPDAAAQEAAKKTLRELFKIDYAQSKKQDGKIALARTLFTRGQEVDNDPPACYVMLHEAADLAAEAGQLGLSWDAIVALADRFEVDRLPLMERAAKTASPFAKTFEEVRELCRLYTNLANEAIRVNDYEIASKVMQAMTQAVKKPLFAVLKDQVTTASKRISALREAFETARSDRDTLRTSPTDPVACLGWGRFLCFHKNNWTEGLPLLALAADPVLSPLAQRELAMNEQSPPPESKDLEKLGDDWWEFAEQEKEPARSNVREHASTFFVLAQGGVLGLGKTALQQKADRIFGTTTFVEALGDDSGAIIAPAELNPGGFFTIECWISTHAKTGIIFSKRHLPEGESSIVCKIDQGIPCIVANADFHWQQVNGKTSINDGGWHHIAVVKVTNQLLLFVDGKLEAQFRDLANYSSKSPWKVGMSRDQRSIAIRACRVRLSSSSRYLLPFVPEKQYGKDSATLYPK